MAETAVGGSTCITLFLFVRPFVFRLPRDFLLFFGMVRACVDFFSSPPPPRMPREVWVRNFGALPPPSRVLRLMRLSTRS